MHYDVIIVGAGPGGLACATKLAQNGVKTLVIEKNSVLGTKVCAGGITWSGLIRLIPERLTERAFPVQHIKSRFQSIQIEEPSPIIATINRKRLGRYMAKIACKFGATILTSTALQTINGSSIKVIDLQNNKLAEYTYEFLVGADGSSSKVRNYLGLPCEKFGIGIHYQIAGKYEKMEWHLNHRFFKNGYGWIFPHHKSISVGAYIDKKCISASELKSRLITWAQQAGFDLSREKCSAGLINYDYRGWHFGDIFLVGDAAGFASALTGEGIYPAIISGESVAEKILGSSSSPERIKRLVIKQKRFSKMVELTSNNTLLSKILAEIGVVALRTKMLDFTALEMGK